MAESVAEPLKYFDNNVCGSDTLFDIMIEFGCKKNVFSSSAAVYGDSMAVPILESFPLRTTNPYGALKLMVEDVLRDLHKGDNNWSVAILRYFNPVGAHPSGLIGEDPNGKPYNLMPYISQVAIGKRAKLEVLGDDYPTHDGTGVRDYIYVMDLVKGHLCALRFIQRQSSVVIVTLGNGKGYSVLDMVKTFEGVSSRSVDYEIVNRRLGDVAQCFADSSCALDLFGWEADSGIENMCLDTWRWQRMNPNGYSNIE